MKIFTKVLKINEHFNASEYIKAHQPENMWPETVTALAEIEVLDMELYLHDDTIIMTMITNDDFNHDIAMAKLATLPRQAEWEAYVAQFQGADKNQSAKDKWQPLDRIYHFKTCQEFLN